MAIATKEQLLDRFAMAEWHVKRAAHHMLLAKGQPEKQDWRPFARSAVAELEAALADIDAETMK